MSNSPDDIAAILRGRIDDLETSVREANVGSIIEVGDGIARVFGLSEALAGELRAEVVLEPGRERWPRGVDAATLEETDDAVADAVDDDVAFPFLKSERETLFGESLAVSEGRHEETSKNDCGR